MSGNLSDIQSEIVAHNTNSDAIANSFERPLLYFANFNNIPIKTHCIEIHRSDLIINESIKYIKLNQNLLIIIDHPNSWKLK